MKDIEKCSTNVFNFKRHVGAITKHCLFVKC